MPQGDRRAGGQQGNGTEQIGQTGDRGWRKKKFIATKNSTNKHRVTSWGKGKGPGGRGGKEQGPTTGPDGKKNHASGRGREEGDQC